MDQPPEANLKASYHLMNERQRKKSGRFLESKTVGFDNPVYAFTEEPKLTDFIMESYNGKKQRSQHCNGSWDVEDHRLPIQTLYQRYGTHPDRGLTQPQVKINQEKYGCNEIMPPKKPSEVIEFGKNVLFGMNILLWICGVFNIMVYALDLYVNHADKREHLHSGIAIIVTVFITGAFSYYQESKSNRIYESFRKMTPHTAVVWRDAKRQVIDSADVVVGDVIEIKYGDWIPADIRIIESQGLRVDNCLLTGESQPQTRRPTFTAKNPLETKNLIFFSTYAIQGSAKGIVIRVGDETYMGRLAVLANSMRSKRSLLSIETKRIVNLVTTSILIIAVVFFAIAMQMHFDTTDAAFLVIGLIVANIPENISTTLTIQLALTAKIMAEKYCYVKNLHAVEGLGSVSAICTEKTGILTQNKMSVAHMWFNNCKVDADTLKNCDTGAAVAIQDSGFSNLLNVAALCSRAKFLPEQDNVPILARKVIGEGSEAAILKFVEMQVGDTKSYRDSKPKVCEIPFNSRNRFQVSIHEMNHCEDERYLLVMKGAPERVISMCTSVLINDEEIPLDDKWKSKILEHARNFARLGERVLGFCDKRLDFKKFPKHYLFDIDNPDFLDEGFRFIGLISLIDPPRAAVPAAITRCKTAGIKVVMITGDHPYTAGAIAQAVGILSKDKSKVKKKLTDVEAQTLKAKTPAIPVLPPSNRIITGSELTRISFDELDRILSTIDEVVFARVLPEQKHLIVESLKRIGHIVAATGDKVHDMPALRTANIGISLGISGADAAKEVSDVILMDDNFATLVSGIQDGRLLFDNLKKLIRFTLADNIAQMYSYWIFLIFRIPLPIATLGMIMVSMCFDVLPAISLVHECPAQDLMKLKPRNVHHDTLLTTYTISYSYGQIALMELAAGFCAYFITFAQHGFLPDKLLYVHKEWDNEAVSDFTDSYDQEWSYFNRQQVQMEAQTAFIMGLVVTQWANAIACKTRRLSIFQKGMQNKLMNFALIAMPAILCFVIYTPGVNNFLCFRPISAGAWFAALPFAALIFVYDELRRYAVRTWQGGWVTNEFYR